MSLTGHSYSSLRKGRGRLIPYQKPRHAVRVLASVVMALTFTTVAHAQGTMDFSGAQTLMGTFNWRNDYAGIEEWSRFIRDAHYCYHTQLHAEHEHFAKLWDENLRQQGFADAFERQRQRHA